MLFRPFAAFAIAAVCLVIVASGSHSQPMPSVATMSTPELRRLCRAGSAEASVLPEADANSILQDYELSRAACDRLVEASSLQGDALVDALLDRARRQGKMTNTNLLWPTMLAQSSSHPAPLMLTGGEARQTFFIRVISRPP